MEHQAPADFDVFLLNMGTLYSSLRIQVCPRKGISPTILFWGWDLDHQSYSREGSGSLGVDDLQNLVHPGKLAFLPQSHGGLIQMIFPLKHGVIFRFSPPLVFGGVSNSC